MDGSSAAAAAMVAATGMAPNPRLQQAFNPLGSIKSKGCSAFDEAGIWSIGCEVVSDEAELAAARALHDELGPLIDGHNDLPWAMRGYAGYDMDRLDLSKDQRDFQGDLQTDIPRLREGGVGGQFWSVFVPTPADPSPENPSSALAVQQTMENIDFVHNMVAKYPESFDFCETADDADRAFAAGKITSFIGMEGGCSIGNSLGVLRMMYRLGCRYMTLTHNGHLNWADSALTRTGTPAEPSAHGGLSTFGKEVVREMNRLGMMVDLAHVSHGTMRAVLDVSVSPVLFSHCKYTSNHSWINVAPEWLWINQAGMYFFERLLFDYSQRLRDLRSSSQRPGRCPGSHSCQRRHLHGDIRRAVRVLGAPFLGIRAEDRDGRIRGDGCQRRPDPPATCPAFGCRGSSDVHEGANRSAAHWHRR